MDRAITLTVDVQAETDEVFAALTTTGGQRSFWTANADVSTDRARFGFAKAPMDLVTAVSTEPGKLVRMRILSGFPFWEGSTFEWELTPAGAAEPGTTVLFRHYGFGAGYPETDLGHSAHTWSQILDRLASYASSGTPQPFFPEPAA